MSNPVLSFWVLGINIKKLMTFLQQNNLGTYFRDFVIFYKIWTLYSRLQVTITTENVCLIVFNCCSKNNI